MTDTILNAMYYMIGLDKESATVFQADFMVVFSCIFVLLIIFGCLFLWRCIFRGLLG